MARIGLCGPTYQAFSPNVSAEWAMKLFPEKVEAGSPKAPYCLRSTLGLQTQFFIADNGPIRGQIVINGRWFVVGAAGDNFFELSATGGAGWGGPAPILYYKLYGNVGNDNLPVSFATNGQQLLVCSAGAVWCFDLNLNTFVSGAADEWDSALVYPKNAAVMYNGLPYVSFQDNNQGNEPDISPTWWFQDDNPQQPAIPVLGTGSNADPVAAISQVGFCDGYFAALQANSRIWQISELEDGRAWDQLDVAEISVFGDNIVSFIVQQRQLWFYGGEHCAIYYNSGDPTFPFDPVPGGFIEAGLDAQDSLVQLDNSLFWLGSDIRGHGIVWRANGYVPQRVSNHAIEWRIQSYGATSNAVCFPYQDQGHSFYVMYFPTPSVMLVYDVATGMWHERGFWDTNVSRYTAARYWNHAYFDGSHYVGDWDNSGAVYQMSTAFFTDAGAAIRRVRRSPYVSRINAKSIWEYHQMIQLDFQSGLGLDSPAAWVSTTQYAVGAAVTYNGGIYISQKAENGDQLPTANPTWWVATVNEGTMPWNPGTTYSVGNQVIYQGLYYQCVAGNNRNQVPIASGAGWVLIFGYPGQNPQVDIHWSDDSAQTWSNSHLVSVGPIGKTDWRAILRQLGRTMQGKRVYEVVMTDPIPWTLADDDLISIPDPRVQ